MTEEQEKRRSFSFVILGRLHGLNDYIRAERSTRYNGASMKRNDTKIVAKYIYKAPKLRPPVWIEYHFFEPTRRRDKDNISGWGHKVINDALRNTGVIGDDNWVWIKGYRDDFSVDRKRPRIEVRIYEMHEGETST